MADKLKATLTYDNAGRVAKVKIAGVEFPVQTAQPVMVMGTPGLMIQIPNVQVDYEGPPEPTAPAAAAQAPAAA